MAVRKRKQTKMAPVESVDMVEENDAYEETTPTNSNAMSVQKRIGIVLVLIVLLLAAAAYKYRYLLTPATVNGQPIYVWTYLSKLHKQYGSDQLNSMSTELMITQAVNKANVTVPDSDIDKEVANVELEASSSGGLKAVLDAQRLSMDEFRNRVKLQLAVKKILADKIKVSDQEIDDAYKKNKDFYKGTSEADAKVTIKKQLEDQKFQQEVQTWLSTVKNSAKIEIKFPGIANQ